MPYQSNDIQSAKISQDCAHVNIKYTGHGETVDGYYDTLTVTSFLRTKGQYITSLAKWFKTRCWETQQELFADFLNDREQRKADHAEAAKWLSPMALGWWDSDTASMDADTRKKMLALIQMAYGHGKTSGFVSGIDKATDIWKGSPKMKEMHTLQATPKEMEQWQAEYDEEQAALDAHNLAMMKRPEPVKGMMACEAIPSRYTPGEAPDAGREFIASLGQKEAA